MTPTDDELIEAYGKGDESAFAALVDRHLPGVYSFAARLVGSKEEAEDIAQQTFVKAWKNLRRFRKGMRFRTWLLAIARNTAIDELRKKRPALFSEFMREDEDAGIEERFPDRSPGAEERFDESLRTDALDAALAKLSAPYREILILHYREELTLDEAARALGIPLNTAKSRDRRALITLRKILGPRTP
jgi:RNA polymerase sigma-70 factor (ECF subfamily)